IMATRDVMMADRYMYLPIVGVFLLMAYGISLAGERFKLSNQVLYGIFGVYVLALVAGSFQRSNVWQNSIDLFTDVIDKAEAKEGTRSPYLSVAYNNRGIAYKDNQQYDLASADYQKAVNVNPSDAKSYTNLGNIKFLNQDYNGAIQDYSKAIEMEDLTGSSYSSRGAAYAMQGQYELAAVDLEAALKIDAYHVDALRNLSMVHYYRQRLDEGITIADRYFQLRPGDADMVNLYGLMYFQKGDNQRALAEFNRSIQMNPNSGTFYVNRALVHERMGNSAAKVQDAQKAQSLGAQVNANLLR
ncbi:MAG: tetratricopeptide repeat protein, partial [Bacteroidota bacterium]